MQVGDYIIMSDNEFKSWVSSIPVEKQDMDKLSDVSEVKVVIKDIINTEDKYGINNSAILIDAERSIKKS